MVAEALTNVAKHGRGAAASVTIGGDASRWWWRWPTMVPVAPIRRDRVLTGLRHRVEALDGTLRVEDRAGRGVRVRAELPCG